MRASIVEKAMKQFEPREKALLKEEQAISKAAWMKNFGPAKLKHARALGEPFVIEGKDYYGKAKPEGTQVTWAFGDYGYRFALHTQLPVPSHVGSDVAKYFRVKDEAICERAKAWHDAVTKLVAEKGKTQATLQALLNKVQTYNSLEKTWPEGKKFYQHIPTDWPHRHQVPAIQMSELNAALGI
jgi:hypothetical protein